MSTAVHITIEPGSEAAELDAWRAWAAPNGLVEGPGWGPWRKGPEIEADYSARGVTFSTFYMGDQTAEVIRLALAFWLRFGGQMDAPPEVKIPIHQAFLAMNPVPQEAKS